MAECSVGVVKYNCYTAPLIPRPLNSIKFFHQKVQYRNQHKARFTLIEIRRVIKIPFSAVPDAVDVTADVYNVGVLVF